MEYEVIIRPKPIVEFETLEDLKRHTERLREENERVRPCPIKFPKDFEIAEALAAWWKAHQIESQDI